MKKVILLISSLLFLCSSLLAGGALTLKQVKEQGLSELVVSHLDLREPVKEALEKVPGGFLLEQPILKQLDTLQENLMKRKDWTQFLDTAGLAFVQCVADEAAQFRIWISSFLNFCQLIRRPYFRIQIWMNQNRGCCFRCCHIS